MKQRIVRSALLFMVFLAGNRGIIAEGYMHFPNAFSINSANLNSLTHSVDSHGTYSFAEYWKVIEGRETPIDTNALRDLKVKWVKGLEIPKTSSSKDRIIKKTGFSLLYNESHEQAEWVAYQLTKSETNSVFERTDNFMVDPMVKTGSAVAADYQGSGYDRGHLAPAGDMGWSAASMTESFYYSNLSPQLPAFNRGIWKRLEEQVRTWAIDYDTLYVVTGPVLQMGLPKIGPNEVSVPGWYYKVILDYSEPGIKGIGFVMPNQGSKLKLQDYAVSIDSVERLTGLDFFPLLDDLQERPIERTLCLPCWDWGNASTGINNSTIHQNTGGIPRPTTSTAVQCSGITQSGNRCKRMTTNPSGRCYQH